MKSPPRAALPSNFEFLPLSASPKGCSFKLLSDVLAENGLTRSIDLVAAIRDGLNPAVYTTEGGEMLADAGSWKLGVSIVATNREVPVERSGSAA
jgi:hypothetical protein